MTSTASAPEQRLRQKGESSGFEEQYPGLEPYIEGAFPVKSAPFTIRAASLASSVTLFGSTNPRHDHNRAAATNTAHHGRQFVITSSRKPSSTIRPPIECPKQAGRSSHSPAKRPARYGLTSSALHPSDTKRRKTESAETQLPDHMQTLGLDAEDEDEDESESDEEPSPAEVVSPEEEGSSSDNIVMNIKRRITQGPAASAEPAQAPPVADDIDQDLVAGALSRKKVKLATKSREGRHVARDLVSTQAGRANPRHLRRQNGARDDLLQCRRRRERRIRIASYGTGHCVQPCQ